MMYSVMKQERENKELTQQELSKILGISRSTYAGWENGIDTIESFLDAYEHFPLRKNSLPIDLGSC